MNFYSVLEDRKATVKNVVWMVSFLCAVFILPAPICALTILPGPEQPKTAFVRASNDKVYQIHYGGKGTSVENFSVSSDGEIVPREIAAELFIIATHFLNHKPVSYTIGEWQAEVDTIFKNTANVRGWDKFAKAIGSTSVNLFISTWSSGGQTFEILKSVSRELLSTTGLVPTPANILKQLERLIKQLEGLTGITLITLPDFIETLEKWTNLNLPEADTIKAVLTLMGSTNPAEILEALEVLTGINLMATESEVLFEAYLVVCDFNIRIAALGQKAVDLWESAYLGSEISIDDIKYAWKAHHQSTEYAGYRSIILNQYIVLPGKLERLGEFFLSITPLSKFGQFMASTGEHISDLRYLENLRSELGGVGLQIGAQASEVINAYFSEGAIAKAIAELESGGFFQNEATHRCEYTLSQSSRDVLASGGSLQVDITTSSTCGWTASSTSGFLSVNPASGTGNGAVTVTVDENTGTRSRTGTLTIADQTFTVRQAGKTTIVSQGLSIGDTVIVNTSSHINTRSEHRRGDNVIGIVYNDAMGTIKDGPWSDEVYKWWKVEWHSLDRMSWYAPPDDDQGWIVEAIGSDTVLVRRSPQCDYTLATTSRDVPATGDEFSVQVTATSGCDWTAKSNDGFLSVNRDRGTGNGTVDVTVDENPSDHPRIGTFRISGAIFTVRQAGKTATIPPEDNPIEQPTSGGVCDRTPQVRDEIVSQVPQISSCADITAEHLSAITTLSLRKEDITRLERGDFDGLSSLERLYLDRNNLYRFPTGIFNGLNNLVRLDLDHNQFTTLRAGDFNGLNNLTTLDLNDNDISTLRAGAFNGLNNLTTLDLDDNPITKIEADAFNGLDNLPRLDLNKSPLRTIRTGAFNGLNSLTHLDLNDTDLSTLPTGAFNGLNSLTHLSLEKNLFTTLGVGVFNGLNSLTHLSLEENELTQLPAGAFNGLNNLTRLDLSDNRLYTLSAGAFNGLNNLTTLILDGNPLRTIEADAFNGLTSLTTLRLDELRLKTIEAGAFNGLNNLTTLDLEDNRLYRISTGMFNGLNNLTTLDLDENPLKTIEANAFNGLVSLTSLRLEELELTTIKANAFNGLNNLTHLYLYDNRLTTLPAGAFNGLNNLTRLDLSDNRLSTLSAGAFNGLNSLTRLKLYGNPLTTIEANAFNGLNNLTGLYLSGLRLTTIETGAFNGLNNLTSLSLEENRLTTIPTGGFNGLNSLTTLDLAENRLTTLPTDVFNGLSTLTKLDLENNQLTTLLAGVFKGLVNLTSLDLRDNPGDPFTLTLELIRTDNTDLTAPGPATVKVKLAQGAPFDITFSLSAQAETLSANTATITRGNTESVPIIVTKSRSGSTTVSLAIVPRVPRGYYGIKMAVGNPLVLFGTGRIYAPYLVKISGTNQQGPPRATLANPLVVQVRAGNGEVFEGVPVTFTVTSGGGKLSTRSTTTDVNGRAESTLTLGNTRRTNTVSVSATGIRKEVTFTIEAVTNVTISDPILRTQIETALNKQPDAPITTTALARLTSLSAPNANISNLTGLEFAINLTHLDLSFNSIWDLAPLATNPGLGSGDTVEARGNPLSYASIHTYIPTLTGRGVTVNFDPRTPTTLLKISGDNQHGNPTSALANPFVVEVQDENGNPFAGVPVTFTVTVGGGWLTLRIVTTNAEGRAQTTFVFENKPIANTVRASVQGISAPVTFNTIAAVDVYIPDASLRAAIETALHKQADTPITTADMATLTSLSETHSNISDLTGLEHAINLTSLALNNNSISDISYVAGLTNLTRLSLYNNSISDISALAGLTKLTSLSLWNNSISDLSTVVGLTNLTELKLSNNSISDISALAGLTKLTSLNLSSNSISDISALTGLTELKGLTIFNNSISDISALTGLTKLVVLWLFNNSISDLSPLVANTGLGSRDRLLVQTNPLSYASIRTHIPTLQSRGVKVSYTNQAHPALLKISGDDQEGIPGATLANPFVVEVQDANGSALAGVAVTFTVTAGEGTLSTTNTTTNANGRAESTLTLGTTPGTNTVSVAATGIQVPATFKIEAVTNVTIPDATLRAQIEPALNKQAGEPITTAEMATLTGLEAPNADISDLTGLEHAINLTELVLNDNSISDISPLTELTELTNLNLNNNSISDLSSLLTNTGLGSGDTVNLLGNPLSPPSIYIYIPTLKSRGVTVAFTAPTHPVILKISGDDQKGTAGTTLANPFVVEVRDANGSAVQGTSVTFAVTAGGGTLSTTSVTTDANGRAASTLTLGNTLGTNTVTVSASGIQQTVTFNADTTGPRQETTVMVIEGTITNPDGTPAEAGLSVTVTIGGNSQTVLSGSGGFYSVTFLSVSGVVARSFDSVEVQVVRGATGKSAQNTVQLSSEQIRAQNATIDLQFSITEYLLSVPSGISLIHVPLKVTVVDGVSESLNSVSDLYDALGGADTVNLLATHSPGTQQWYSYLGSSNRGTAADPALTDELGIMASMKASVSLRLSGDALGTNGRSSISLQSGTNLVGIPLKDPRITRVSDLFALEGIKDNVSEIITQSGDASDVQLTGGQAFIMFAQEAATVAIAGEGWSNAIGTTASPSIALALTGIRVDSATPVLAITGSIVEEVRGLNTDRFRITVKNLSTGKALTTVTDEGMGYQLTAVDMATGRVAQIGDILEITAQSPNPFVGVQPLRHIVTAEDVRRSHIPLAQLIAYEIPAKTELLLNYPNPFNPETWIPYRLAENANVTLTIYDLSGRVVRRLNLGHQIAAVYESREKAIHWDGRTEFGERVASGIYFYHLSAGNYSAARKMVILK